MKRKVVYFCVFIMLISLNIIFCGCKKNVEGTWYIVSQSTSEDEEYIVEEYIEITKEHFIINGEAYIYTLDEDYLIVSNFYTYKIETDEEYGEVLTYNDEIYAYKDKDKANESAKQQRLTKSQERQTYQDIDELTEQLTD